MAKFDFPYTCPDINRQIETFKDKMSDYVDEIIKDLSPLFYETRESTTYREKCLDEIYDFTEACFEKTRETNSDMRAEADTQLWRLEGELTGEIDSLNEKITGLEEELEEANNELNDLREKLKQYEII